MLYFFRFILFFISVDVSRIKIYLDISILVASNIYIGWSSRMLQSYVYVTLGQAHVVQTTPPSVVMHGIARTGGRGDNYPTGNASLQLAIAPTSARSNSQLAKLSSLLHYAGEVTGEY
jgi:hypothetical protein